MLIAYLSISVCTQSRERAAKWDRLFPESLRRRHDPTWQQLGSILVVRPKALAKRVVIDHRSDIYSLGMTLYELLTLRPAFDTANRQELLKQIAFEDPPKPRRLKRSIPHELETIVLKAIEKNPDERYATAQQLADDLSCFVQNRPIAAKPPGISIKVRKWAQRNPQLSAVFAVATSMVAVIALIAGAQSQAAYRREHNQRGIAEKATTTATNESKNARRALDAETEAKLKSQENLYRAHIREAQEAIGRGNIRYAESLLFRYLTDNDDTDFRGWEWFYLVGQLDSASTLVGTHSEMVYHVAYHPSGRQIASVSAQDILIWDSQSHRVQQEIHIPYGDILGGAYDRNGEHLAVASADGIVRILNAGGTDFVTTLRPAKEHAFSVARQTPAWSPDGTMIAVPLDGSVVIHILTSNRQRAIEFEPGDMFSVSWSPDGRELAVGRSGRLEIVDITSGKTRLSIPAHQHDLWSIDWDSKGTRIATGSFDERLKVFRADTGEPLHDLRQPSGVTSVKFSPNDRYLACGTTGHAVLIGARPNKQAA